MNIQITAKYKLAHGTSHSKKLRRTNMLPAVIYNHGISTPIYLTDAAAFSLLFKKGLLHNPIELIIVDNEALSCRVKIQRIQKDPISVNFLHVDFIKLADIND